MNNITPIIPLTNLAFMLIPVLLTASFFCRWLKDYRTVSHAFLRMVVQLLLIGYALNYLFTVNNPAMVAVLLVIMLVVSSWIALRPLQHKTRICYIKVLISIAIGTALSLVFSTQFVLDLDPWFSIKHTIPLAGIIFANAMNTVSLAAERLESEIHTGKNYMTARSVALQAAMIPSINMLFAVGVVSLPGFMTGQILSGVSPLIAVRYQIMVMAMIFSAAGMASICYLVLSKPATQINE